MEEVQLSGDSSIAMRAKWTLLWLFVALWPLLYTSQATAHVLKTPADVPRSRILQASSPSSSYNLRGSKGPSPNHAPQLSTPSPTWPYLEEEEMLEAIEGRSDDASANDASTNPIDKDNNGTEEALGPEQEALNRSKRKVVSRGGHYIIKSSSSGNSPWSSSSYDSYSSYRTSRPRSYGWNPRGRIGDGGTRTATFGEVRRTRPSRRSPRKKLSRSFKSEIAQYAMQNGAQKAALHYEYRVGRRLKDRVVEKFVQRYQERTKKSKKKSRP